MKYLITGGAGFIGSNLAHEVLRRGDQLTIADNLSRPGAAANIAWLETKGTLHFAHVDVRNRHDVEQLICGLKPDVVFHMAGQVAMTTSLENPALDFETNVLGGFHVLEALRLHAPNAVFLYSSTNKVYGSLEYVSLIEEPLRYVAPDYPDGFDETIALDFQSPYGCSKGAVDQYARDYWRMFGLKTVVFRHSSVFGTRQFSTFDQGWVGWFVGQALATRADPHREQFTIAGNGKQVRDVLFVDDLVACYFTTLAAGDGVWGRVFNLGGGTENSLSLLELVGLLEQHVNVPLPFRSVAWRRSDQRLFVANTASIRQVTGWRPLVGKQEGIARMIRWVEERHG